MPRPAAHHTKTVTEITAFYDFLLHTRRMNSVNHVPLIDISASKTGCCGLIVPKEWDEQTVIFKDKLFVKAKVRSFLHIPLNMSSVMTKTQARIKEAGADLEEFLILSYEASPWHSVQYFAVSKEVPGLDSEKLTGTFLTKVFEGPYKDAGKWYNQLADYAKSRGEKPLKSYFFYTTCPKCAKAYGKNYVVGFQEVA